MDVDLVDVSDPSMFLGCLLYHLLHLLNHQKQSRAARSITPPPLSHSPTHPLAHALTRISPSSLPYFTSYYLLRIYLPRYLTY